MFSPLMFTRIFGGNKFWGGFAVLSQFAIISVNGCSELLKDDYWLKVEHWCFPSPMLYPRASDVPSFFWSVSLNVNQNCFWGAFPT